uniref:ALMS motif domain-containing protein n=1 Tax=Lutzomyia longipalpis TaxID=7200 RepID=A0A7G3B488_LUTLO
MSRKKPLGSILPVVSVLKLKMSHQCPLDKEKYPLSTQILNYYFKYGQNRNLEKYLKPARSKSSSEGSLSVAHNKYINQLTKSLENLNVLLNLGEKEAAQEEGVAAPQSAKEKSHEEEGKTPRKEKEPPESGRKKGKYQFVIDSNVNITIPLNPAPIAEVRQHVEPLPGTSHQPIGNVAPPEMPLEGKQGVSTSPTSSVISNKQRLEWDSLADIGYEFCNLTETQMSSQEKAVLRKFFTERGLQLNHPLILLSPNIAGAKGSNVRKDGNDVERAPKPQKAVSKINFNEGEFSQSTPLRPPIAHEEKSSQTTSKEFLSKSVQAEKSMLQEQNSEDQTPPQHPTGGLQETRGSFEFFGPPRILQNKENISPTSSLKTSSSKSKNNTGDELRAHISSYLDSSQAEDDFQRNLQRATSLITLLMDSKSISAGTKKDLVRKIFDKLAKSYRSRSQSKSEISSNSRTSEHSRRFYVDEFQKSEFLKEWLKPLTNSSGDYRAPEDASKPCSVVSQPLSKPQSQPVSEGSVRSQKTETSRKSSAKFSGNADDQGVSKETLAKELQLLRIDQEIEHLRGIRKMILERSNRAQMDPLQGIDDQKYEESALSAAGTSSWNSHCNMKQFVKNRSKLKTPSDHSEAVESSGSIPNSQNISQSISSGKYYSEPVELNYQGKVVAKSKKSITPHSTTFSSLLSSSHDPLPAAPATAASVVPKRSTVKSAQTQTYDSIRGINNAVMNKQQQTKLESIAYIITLDRAADKRVKGVQEYLVENRPGFVCSANERKNQIELQRQERHRRNDEREKLLKAKTLPMHKLHSLLKPQRHSPKSNTSVIYKQKTRRKYNNLAEQIKKKEMEKTKTYRENIKMIQMMFNKNLQRKALHGETTIPHSVPVIKSI